jgi:hypothetical protein
MLVIFVHGWSVRNTDTYGDLPRYLEQQTGLQIQVGNVYLGKYVSFDDTVTLDDLARAFHQAIRDELDKKLTAGEKFACITHSTGGPVVRKWMALYYPDPAACPMSHCIMLAPANHGSALAQLGKTRLSRLKFLLEGAECGEKVLDWLELGSDLSWELNSDWLERDFSSSQIYLFVLTGQKIDRKMYDHLNAYTGEAGSDGVVRVAAANLNYSLLRLAQKGTTLKVERNRTAASTAFGILPGRSHSGKEIGIIRSVTLDNADRHPTAQWVLRCLQVRNRAGYNRLVRELQDLTAETQEAEALDLEKWLFGTRKYEISRYSMVVFRLVDDRGQSLSDYDLYLTAGPNYSENDLPKGFFVDRQRNKRNPGKLTYYLDYDAIAGEKKLEGKLGFRIVARPEAGLAFYRLLDFRSKVATISRILRPNETVMVEIVMQRQVDATVFRISSDLNPGPIDPTPSGRLVE